jgi:hypothetical protein
MKIYFNTVVDQFYLLPTIKITYNTSLTGYYGIEVYLLKWGVELIW